MDATGIDREAARAKIDEAGKDVKLAVTMVLGNMDREAAEEALLKAKGHVREAVERK